MVGQRDNWKYSLRPPRAPNRHARTVMGVLVGDMCVRGLWIAYLVVYQLQPVCLNEFGSTCMANLLGPVPLTIMAIEIFASSVFVAKFGRWEEHAHMITFWEVLAAWMVFLVRRALYNNPALFLIQMLGLIATYVVGILTNFYENGEVRIPKFCPKNADRDKPRGGWLGVGSFNRYRTMFSRCLITLIMYLTMCTKIIGITYFGGISVEDDLRGMDGNLSILFSIAIGLSVITLLPNLIVDFSTMPEFWDDFRTTKKSSNAYKTGGYEVMTIDEDAREDSDLKRQLKGHKCASLTVVVPCYMPNEEEIIFEVLDTYKKEQKEYPGEFKVMIVWNSPKEHTETEERLSAYAAQWPHLVVHRVINSTSKCDNLNYAIDRLTTEIALLNDADTIVNAATMCRASLNIMTGKKVDIAQSVNSHCAEDKSGCIEGSGFFCFGPMVTMIDSSKPKKYRHPGQVPTCAFQRPWRFLVRGCAQEGGLRPPYHRGGS